MKKLAQLLSILEFFGFLRELCVKLNKQPHYRTFVPLEMGVLYQDCRVDEDLSSFFIFCKISVLEEKKSVYILSFAGPSELYHTRIRRRNKDDDISLKSGFAILKLMTRWIQYWQEVIFIRFTFSEIYWLPMDAFESCGTNTYTSQLFVPISYIRVSELILLAQFFFSRT